MVRGAWRRVQCHSAASLSIVWLLTLPLFAQTSPQPPPPAAEITNGTHSAQAVRVDRAPKLDGTLNDPLWQQAIPITNFLQREPYEGQPATEPTEVRVLYTDREVYSELVASTQSLGRL